MPIEEEINTIHHSPRSKLCLLRFQPALEISNLLDLLTQSILQLDAIASLLLKLHQGGSLVSAEVGAQVQTGRGGTAGGAGYFGSQLCKVPGVIKQ